ncbi:MAG: TIGR02206 family membrane protein [Leptolinea sp.]|nr:TIGR02206 family membrane protein [Leptolinea sp.]
MDYFSRDYNGGAFVLFGRDHLLTLALVLTVCVLIYCFRNRWTESAKKATRLGLFIVIYICEGSWQIWMWAIGSWTIQGMLPLWLCSAVSWTMPLLLIFRSRRYFEWAYYMGLIGAVMALLSPDLMQYGFPHYRFIEFMTLHGTIIVAIVYMTLIEGFRPTGRVLPVVLIITNLYWLMCAGVNNLIGSNYLYTQGKLPTPSLLDYLGPHPWYLLWMEVIGIILCVLLYLPFVWKDRQKGWIRSGEQGR